MLMVFIPRETLPGETRTSATPDTVRRLVKEGFAVHVEAGAGHGAQIQDAAYEKAGATLEREPGEAYARADAVLKLHPPRPDEAARLRPGAVLIGFLDPFRNLDLIEQLRDGQVSALAMETLPRLARAQKMDALSSQTNIAGYKAVLMGADALPKLFPMLMTAAGTITPARVVVLGAGVAGLQAIATAMRLGAVVEASDVRPAVKEQVESLGARFIEAPPQVQAADEGGYAKQQSEEFLTRQRARVRARIVEADVVITTASVPGKRAPLLITADMVSEMREGSVIVDLAVETGGNCELSERGKTVRKDGVTIIARENIPALVPVHASDMYARNVMNLLLYLLKDNRLEINLQDDLIQGALITHRGEVLHAATLEALKARGNP